MQWVLALAPKVIGRIVLSQRISVRYFVYMLSSLIILLLVSLGYSVRNVRS